MNQKPQPEPPKSKLLDKVRDPARIRHLALSTEQAYARWGQEIHHVPRHPPSA